MMLLAVPCAWGGTLENALVDFSFTKFPENPIISPSLPSDPDFQSSDTRHCLHQCVRRKDDGSPYMMWYTGSPDVAPGGFSERKIHLATSNDGVNFTKQGVVVSKTPGNLFFWDGVQVHMPTVIWHNNQWMMWYVGHNNGGSPGWYKIGLATSQNGISWTKYGMVFDVNPDPNAFDSDTVRQPAVLFDPDDNLYRMWYNSTDNSQEAFGPTGYAESPDGINWTRIAQIADAPGHFGRRLEGNDVLKIGNVFHSFHNQGPYLSYAVSFDGIVWLDSPQSPVLVTTQNTWDRGYVQAPSVVYHPASGVLNLYYNGFQAFEQIGGVSTTFLPSPTGNYLADMDDDVDMEDHGLFQACLTAPAVAQLDPACSNARLDADTDVDKEDTTLFLGCLSGANVTPPPACAL